MGDTETVKRILAKGLVIPACPLALDSRRKLDERRQRALFRYYRAAGAGGIAVGVHTTQFAIHDSNVGLLKPVWELAAAEWPSVDDARIRVAGLCGSTPQACAEADLARQLGFGAGLLSLSALKHARDDELIDHCKAVGEGIPLFGFYLQPSAGGGLLSYAFWRRFAEIPSVVAIKIAPFNRYQTLEVIRAVTESGRTDIALYTGNDDNILADLLTPFRFKYRERLVERRMVGGLLGHWAVWTKKAVELHNECRLAQSGAPILSDTLRLAAEVTDANSAFFDAANGFAGCIPGIHEVLRRQGLLEGVWCLDPKETLSPGQAEHIERVCEAYPHLNDDQFVLQNRDEWLR